MDKDIKYYVYISDAKVDMLYPQIPKPLLKKIASSLSIDLKLLGAEVSIGAKSNPSDETRYAKVKIVSEYIEKHLDVGTVEFPRSYFKGTLKMNWGKRGGIVLFHGSGYTILTGSAHHVIGNQNVQEMGERRSGSGLETAELMGLVIALLSKEKELPPEDAFSLSDATQVIEGNERYIDTIFFQGLNRLKWPLPWREWPQFEFLAKTLLHLEKSYLIGTPIYVAYATIPIKPLMPQKLCPKCGGSNPVDALFCDECGTRLRDDTTNSKNL